jgi:GntR family transcriptional regulator
VAQRPNPGRRNNRRGQGRSRSVQWVCDLIRTELLTGEHADVPLPGEDVLIRRYGVSRGVVRDVLAILAEQGVVERVRGAGTFATAPGALRHEIDVSRDLAQDVNATGTRIAIRTTYADLHPAPPFIAGTLEVPVGEDVVIVESVTSLDGFPLSLRSAFMPADPFGVLVTDPAADLDRSPYDLISEVLRTPVGDTELQISSSTADPIAAEALHVSPGSALLDTTRLVRAADGTPVEYSMSHARADRLVVSTVMRACDGPPSAAHELRASPRIGRGSAQAS